MTSLLLSPVALTDLRYYYKENLDYLYSCIRVDLGNSDIFGMQCFCSVVSKMVSEHDRRSQLKSRLIHMVH